MNQQEKHEPHLDIQYAPDGTELGTPVEDDPRLGRLVKVSHTRPDTLWVIGQVWRWSYGYERFSVQTVQPPHTGFDVEVDEVTFVEQGEQASMTERGEVYIPHYDIKLNAELGQPLENDPRVGRRVTLESYPGYTWEIKQVWRWPADWETFALECIEYPDAGFDVPAHTCKFVGGEKNAACDTSTKQH